MHSKVCSPAPSMFFGPGWAPASRYAKARISHLKAADLTSVRLGQHASSFCMLSSQVFENCCLRCSPDLCQDASCRFLW